MSLYISVETLCFVDVKVTLYLQLKVPKLFFVFQVEEKPDVTYSDVGGCKEQIEKLREVVETPLLHVSKACV